MLRDSRRSKGRTKKDGKMTVEEAHSYTKCSENIVLDGQLETEFYAVGKKVWAIRIEGLLSVVR